MHLILIIACGVVLGYLIVALILGLLGLLVWSCTGNTPTSLSGFFGSSTANNQ